MSNRERDTGMMFLLLLVVLHTPCNVLLTWVKTQKLAKHALLLIIFAVALSFMRLTLGRTSNRSQMVLLIHLLEGRLPEFPSVPGTLTLPSLWSFTREATIKEMSSALQLAHVHIIIAPSMVYITLAIYFYCNDCTFTHWSRLQRTNFKQKPSVEPSTACNWILSQF